ncbi:MAG: MBL fold metallo-hydrolase [Gammaproteobacteria bacterium AqS3]|nr:MBL fold metallo-hydrolase [Gammaproteobacteria bacterium AqS3]
MSTENSIRLGLWVLCITAGVALVGCIALLILMFSRGVQDGLIESAVQSQLQSVQERRERLDAEALHVFVCGAGTPLNREMAQQCLAVVAGDTTLIFDAGARSVVRLLDMPEIDPGGIDAVFITHTHSDHIAGLGELNLISWIGGGRTEPLPVYGAPDVTDVVEGFNRAYSPDGDFRTDHHGEGIAPPQGRPMRPHPFEPGIEMQPVYESGEVSVEAMEVVHPPVRGAVGYRVRHRDRSIVISGDTDLSEDLLKASDGVDVLIHEGMLKDVVALMSRIAAQEGAERLANIFTDILNYHADLAELQDAIAERQIDIRLLLINHLVPQPNFIIERRIKAIFDDAPYRVKLARDRMRISLPLGSAQVEVYPTGD